MCCGFFLLHSYLCQSELCEERRSVHVQVKWHELRLRTAEHKQEGIRKGPPDTLKHNKDTMFCTEWH